MKESNNLVTTNSLENKDKLDSELQQIWSEVLARHPELSRVEIIVPDDNTTLSYTGGEFLLPEEGYPDPAIVILPSDGSVYEKLKDFEKKHHRSAVIRANDDQESHISPPNKSIDWQTPIITLKPLLHLSDEEQRQILMPLIKEWNDTVNTLSLPFADEEYEALMKIIEEIDFNTYTNLRACQQALKKPCLMQGKQYKRIEPTEDSEEYPLIVVPTDIITWPKDEQKGYLKKAVQDYHPLPPMTESERLHYLEIIKSLAPGLYDEFMKLDPTGTKHIIRRNGFIHGHVVPFPEDGLPSLAIGFGNKTLPIEQQYYLIAHELSHYVLNHFQNPPHPHKRLNPHALASPLMIKGKEVPAPFPHDEAFLKAASRTREAEADRFAIMYFGANNEQVLEGALAYNGFNPSIDYFPTKNKPEKIDFTLMHPPAKERVKQLLSLGKEIELQKAKEEQLKPINWEALRGEYIGKTWDNIE